jgi:hypothetical protein
MSNDVNFVIFPGGERLVRNDDEAAAKAEALRLGLLPELIVQLRSRTGQRGAAGIARDGDRIVAVVVWAGFKSASDNGWITLTATPACEKTADWLVRIAHTLIDATSVQFMERGSPWRN